MYRFVWLLFWRGIVRQGNPHSYNFKILIRWLPSRRFLSVQSCFFPLLRNLEYWQSVWTGANNLNWTDSLNWRQWSVWIGPDGLNWNRWSVWWEVMVCFNWSRQVVLNWCWWLVWIGANSLNWWPIDFKETLDYGMSCDPYYGLFWWWTGSGWYLVVQHGERRETLQDARLKKVGEDPNHSHLDVPVTWTQAGKRVRELKGFDKSKSMLELSELCRCQETVLTLFYPVSSSFQHIRPPPNTHTHAHLQPSTISTINQEFQDSVWLKDSGGVQCLDHRHLLIKSKEII